MKWGGLSQQELSDTGENEICDLREMVHPLKWIFFPRLIDEFASSGVDRPVVTLDLGEVTFIEGQAQRLEKLGNLVGGLIGKVRGKGKAEGRLFAHGLFSMFFRFRGGVLSRLVSFWFRHTQ